MQGVGVIQAPRIHKMSPDELLTYLVEYPSHVMNDKNKQVLVRNAIMNHQRTLKRACDLLKVIVENQ
jgi:hypothetical protein